MSKKSLACWIKKLESRLKPSLFFFVKIEGIYGHNNVEFTEQQFEEYKKTLPENAEIIIIEVTENKPRVDQSD
jgi:hypothetical protein